VPSDVFGAIVWSLFAWPQNYRGHGPKPVTFSYALRPVVIDAAKPKDKPYAMTDGGGLYLEILPTGTKVWRYKFHYNGRRGKITIGRYPAVSLKDARQRYAEPLES